jgi:hypothetical protein
MKKYRIINQRGTYLSAFHSNGGWEIGDVFPCSSNSWLTFETEKEVQDYLLRLKIESLEEADRWGGWLDKALKFVKSLGYEAYECTWN